jgi:DNA-binding response OmpR family regulator
MNHVLIIDDESEIRDSLEEILREESYAVTTAATGDEGLTLIRDALTMSCCSISGFPTGTAWKC